ncbi:MAG: FHA domain-containing protein, partial [Nitrospiraceae bacterium]
MAPAGHYALMVVTGPDQPHMFMLTQFPARIGRNENDQVRLSDPAVSPAHCDILAIDGALWLTALSPDAPVTVDGTPVAQGTPARLTANHSKIVVGGTTLALRDISALLGKMESDLNAEEQRAAPMETAKASGPPAFERTISDLVPPTMMFKSETQA